MFGRAFSGLVFGLFSSIAGAQSYFAPPQDGLWWNPAESGIGWTLETENNVTVITHYAFTASGAPTFFLTAGVYDGRTRTINGLWESYSGGQCIGCPYTAPTGVSLGAIRWVFTSDTQGQIIYPNGAVIPIEKLHFIYTDPRAYVKGEWAVAEAGIIANAFFLRLTTDAASPANTVLGQTIH